MRISAFLLVVPIVLGTVAGNSAHGAEAEPPAKEEQLTAVEVEPAAFGFSVSTLTSSLGLTLRGLLGSKSAVDRVRDIVDPASLQYNYYGAASRVLNTWAANSAFAGLVRVNQPLKPGFINFFILDHARLAAKAPGLSCNCSYVPGSWSIVCDGQFLASAQRFLESKAAAERAAEQGEQTKAKADKDKKASKKSGGRAPKSETTEDFEPLIQNLFRNFLFEWMIAHELGHLVNNHTEQDMARSWTYGSGIPVGIAAEKEADEYYISNLQHQAQQQFNAWLGLSNVVTRLYGQAVQQQHKEELQAQIDKHGPQFIFNTELDVDIKYVANKHPPLLLRALNLADLVIARYPAIVDSSGYFDRIHARVKPVPSSEPDTPALCQMDAPIDQDSSEEQTIAKHLEILAVQSAPQAWTRPTIEKLRNIIAKKQDTDVRILNELATKLIEAAAQGDANAVGAAVAAANTAANTISEPSKTTLRLLVLVANARAGLLPAATSVVEAVKSGEDRFNELAKAGAFDAGQPAEKAEALRMLLQIALSPGKERDAGSERLIDSIVAEIVALKDIADLDKQLLLQILEADFAAIGKGNSKERTEHMVNAAARVIELAGSQFWPVITRNYLGSQVALLEGITPKPEAELMVGYFNLGRQLRFSGSAEQAPAMFQKGLDYADALLASPGRGEADKRAIAAVRLTLLNNLGYSLLSTRQFSNAVAPLELARAGRLQQRVGRTVCEKNHREDAELATVNQNLADVSLALGRFSDASGYAHEARQCRTELGMEYKALESSKTEGYGLIYSGKQDDGSALLRKYSAEIRRILDDDILPPNDPFISGAIVDGTFVPLEKFVEIIPDSNRPRKIERPARPAGSGQQ
jgi:hypothetical protein